jgi:hypothetical protein
MSEDYTSEGTGAMMQATLPGLGALITGSARYALKSWRLVLWYIGTFVVLGLCAGALFAGAAMAGVFNSPIFGGTLIALALLGLFLLAMVAGTALTYAATAATPTDFRTGVRWTMKNFWSFLWVAALGSLVLLTGFVFLIIPALIFGVYLYFSQLARMHHSMRGMEALRYSTYLVKENWWGVFGRSFAILVLYMLFIGIFQMIFITIFGEDWADTFMAVVSAFGTVFLLHVMGVMYHSLVSQKTAYNPARTYSPSGLYVPAAWLGAILMVVLPALFVYVGYTERDALLRYLESEAGVAPDTNMQYQLDEGTLSPEEFEAFKRVMEAQLQAEIDSVE